MQHIQNCNNKKKKKNKFYKKRPDIATRCSYTFDYLTFKNNTREGRPKCIVLFCLFDKVTRNDDALPYTHAVSFFFSCHSKFESEFQKIKIILPSIEYLQFKPDANQYTN